MSSKTIYLSNMFPPWTQLIRTTPSTHFCHQFCQRKKQPLLLACFPSVLFKRETIPLTSSTTFSDTTPKINKFWQRHQYVGSPLKPSPEFTPNSGDESVFATNSGGGPLFATNFVRLDVRNQHRKINRFRTTI